MFPVIKTFSIIRISPDIIIDISRIDAENCPLELMQRIVPDVKLRIEADFLNNTLVRTKNFVILISRFNPGFHDIPEWNPALKIIAQDKFPLVYTCYDQNESRLDCIKLRMYGIDCIIPIIFQTSIFELWRKIWKTVERDGKS